MESPGPLRNLLGICSIISCHWVVCNETCDEKFDNTYGNPIENFKIQIQIQKWFIVQSTINQHKINI